MRMKNLITDVPGLSVGAADDAPLASGVSLVVFDRRTAAARDGATTADVKGGLGSASAVSSQGYVVGALVAVNAVGRATRGSAPNFWAAPYERGAEFGGLGVGATQAADALELRLKRDE